MPLAETSVRRPVTTLMVYVGIIFLGLIAYRNLAVDFLPPISIPRLTVQTTYAGTTPEEIESAVTQQVESALGTIAGVKRVSSVTREGMSVVSLEFYWGTNMDFALIETREKLDQIRSVLPREAGRPTILTIDPGTEPILTLGIAQRRGGGASDGATSVSDLVSLKETARALVKRRVEQVEGVAQATVLGGVEREIRVNVDMEKLTSLGLTISGVSDALNAANMTLPGGTLKQGLFRYSLRTVGEFSHPHEILKVAVGSAINGRSLTVADIATVADTIAERQGLARYSGAEIVALQVRKEAGANTVDVSKQVHDVIDELAKEYPAFSIFVLSDQAEFISKSISDVEQAILIGALLAFLVLFFFLRRPKYPVVVGLTMPVSILATLIVMFFLRINLNVISLSGLALGIGMLGDNAIILVENMTRLREKGWGLTEATLEGAKEISVAVTASTLTNVAIFLPIIFVQGVASQLFLDMGITMTVSLLVSLVVAVTLVPMLISRELPMTSWVKENVFGKQFHALVDRVNDATHSSMDTYLAWALQHRGRVVGATLLLFVLSVVVSLFITSEPAPDIDQSRFVVQLVLPRGSSLESTSAMAAEFEKEMRSLPGVLGVYSSVGITDEANYWGSSDAATERAMLEVKLKPGRPTSETLDATRELIRRGEKWRHGVEFSIKPRGTTFEQILRPQSSDIRIKIQGPDPETAQLVAQRFAEECTAVPGLVDLRTSLQRGGPVYRIEVDREAASRKGLSVEAVARRVAEQVRGKEATTLADFDRKVTIRVIPAAGGKEAIDEVLASPILVEGVPVPLRSLVHVDRTEGSAEIWRENQQRAVVFLGNVSGRSLSSVVDELNTRARALRTPPGYTITMGGENEEVDESFRSLLIIILLSIFLVYMILAGEYESILYPLVIMLTSPLAFIGAILAMVMAGQHYNVMSLIGIVIMIGAVDNDAVIAVDIITALRRKGLPLAEAIRSGMQQRLRPIVMTTATTVLGIVPLVFSFGTGSELVRALTIPIVGGLIASTVFTVVAIPIVYTYIDRWAIGKKA